MPDVFIQQSPELQAFTIGIQKRFYIVITSGLVENFDDGELLFVIGHEMGHIKCDHIIFYSVVLLYSFIMMSNIFFKIITIPSLLPIFDWSRKAEVSADRAGLIVSKSITKSLSAMLKMSGGTKIMKNVSIKDFLKQNDMIKKTPSRFIEFFLTHPYLPKRALALVEFYKSKYYSNIINGKRTKEVDRKVVEEKVKKILKVL